ncbi:MAG: VWA domain-containing protein [Flavobacteriales bacterium]|nr:VWA domain-containing protein [Flavobacteriales bacterium]
MRLFICTLFFLASLGGFAQEQTRILFVFDASNSMNAYWGQERKIHTATRLLGESLNELYGLENVQLGLRVYGHQTKHVPGEQDCDDTELVVPIAEGNNLIIKKELERITPQGTTPIARSLEKAAGDFEDASGRNVIILITDGIEACDEDPCAVSRALQAKNIIVKPFIIGIGLEDKYKTTFECVGNYFDATDEETFELILDIVVTQALNDTSAQVDLLDHNNNPIETDMPFSLYNEKGELVYDYVHTMNSYDRPDTLTLDPLPTYRLVVHSWPPVEQEGIKLKPGEHNVIEVPLGQGYLDIQMNGTRLESRGLSALVRTKDCEDVYKQSVNTQVRYISGTYDVKILTTPEINTEIEVKGGETAVLNIPSPGGLILQTAGSGQGGIFVKDGNEWRCVIRFDEGNPSGKYSLQPGKYKVVFRSRNARKTVYTKEKEFTIKSGVNANIQIN